MLGLRLITMEEKPRAIELRGEEVMPAVHAYGTNGIIVELEMPLARAWPWHEVVVSFADIAAAADFAKALCEADGIVRKLVSVSDWGAAQYFRPLLPHLKAGEAVALCVVADPSREAFAALAASLGGTIVFERDAAEAGDIPPLYEFTWNHTTLWALKADRTITYLQCLFDGPDYLDKIARTVATFGDETPMHLEFTRLGGHVAAFGLQLVRYTNEQTPLRDHPLARGRGLSCRRSAHLYPGGWRHEDGRRGPARLQAPGRSARTLESGKDEGVDRRCCASPSRSSAIGEVPAQRAEGSLATKPLSPMTPPSPYDGDSLPFADSAKGRK